MKKRRLPLVVATLATLATGALAGPSVRGAQSAAQGDLHRLPAGHPRLDAGVIDAGPIPRRAEVIDGSQDDDPESEAALPPGHPSTGSAGDEASNPHGAAASSGMFEAPPDTADEDASLPAGAIVATILDPENRPLPGETVTLALLHQSVAKGESREHRTSTCDVEGKTHFEGLETGSGIAYRVTVVKDGATFAALPFQLPLTKGMRITLHVYPVTHDIQQAMVVMQAILFAELKDDRVQIQEAITIYNFGKIAWVPEGMVIRLPPEFTALNNNQQMGDHGVDAVEKVGVRLRGTFAPGRKDLEFRWQLPYDGEREVVFDVGLPPHVAMMRVMALASRTMRLTVEGFPEAEKRNDAQGQRLLVIEKQLRREEAPLASLHVSLTDLPSAGPGRIIASCLAAFGVLAGVFLAWGAAPGDSRAKPRAKGQRGQLLDDLEALERAHAAGDLGPKTYERARRDLIDAIARTLSAQSDNH